jgi:iron transport multicopper oxidase
VLQDLFDSVPDGLNYNATGWLVYDKAAPLPAGAEIDEWTDYDDFTLQAQDGMAVYDKVDHSVQLDLSMDDLGDGANYAFFNGISYVRPKVPTLYTAMSVGGDNTDARVYGRDTNAFVLAKGEVVEIVLNNDDGGKHPFHLHGHAFQVVARSDDDAGHYDPNNHTDFPAVPMRRDTVMVRPNGNFVVRFKADNPGVWL